MMNKPSLRKLQQLFSDSIFGDDMVVPSLAGSSVQRFGVYRSSVLETYRKTLTSIFPVTCRLVGEAFFSQMATHFARQTDSISGDLNHYGINFPQFIDTYQPARDLSYLADVARLEWRWHETFHSSDSSPLDLEKLATVDPAEYGRIVFDVQAGYRSMLSLYPVSRIWQVNQAQHIDPESVDLEVSPRWFAIYRFGFEVRIANLTHGMHALAEALKEKRPWSEVTQYALVADQGLDVEAALGWLVNEQIISGFTFDGASTGSTEAGT